MVIERVLNNNACLSENHDGLPVLLMGKGLCFGKRKGSPVDMDLVDKTFILKDHDTMNQFTDLAIDVPMNEIMIAEKVINYAKIRTGKKYSESIYVNLTDHLHNTIKQAKEGIQLSNPLKWDIARFYPDEYAVGQKAIQIVNDEIGVALKDDEAAFIALHFVNADTSNGTEQNRAYDVTKIMKEVEGIVKDFFNTEFDENSLAYYRFITHLKFFAQRLLEGQHYEDDDLDLLETIKRRYPRPYACCKQIQAYIQKKYHFNVTDTEMMYMTVHISRLVKNL
ncbi:transcription antiterminator BglG [Lacticaseibacillus chiayiensis]|uniref:PRD domain-containing protein n=1 Tax=Lacticaseibacillus chiayiensis TaxID=2100821 RepID=A0A4Q1UF92_9LACO|nr:PRD domain-containing protein [Lacticaseibacillus chiayiensis]QVI34605.1 PRD domain-containing protein [Lacticaseibacillus chiayiensis]RXT30689.1 transcription antiterminator BglG [Lacticaseibacillus chiayiensis]RXT59012.1 transcription antiterminator BglG [Lacticaseibacillus chiayiensis]UYN56352.1 PRD domain-containing protein [Lacticaseibacillus chiayiensis]